LSQFSKKTDGAIFEIKCPQKLDAQAAQEFADQSKAWMMSDATHFALDLADVKIMNRDFYRAVIKLKQVLKPDGKVVCSLNVSEEMLKQLRDDGVEAVFVPVHSREELLHPKPSASSSLNTLLLQAFLRATKTTFEVQAQTPISILKPYPRTGVVQGTVIGAEIALDSNGPIGSFYLGLSTPVFLKIYENMFGEKHETIGPEMQDAAAEFVNIIYGLAKTELNPKGHRFAPAFPVVLFGEKLATAQRRPRPAIVVPFETSVGRFHIELEIEK
jgi:CheY-specific phosphatase CheX/anti-anti-sigma regulatory factor